MNVAVKTMKEVLEARGWTMYYECTRCDGKRQYFANPSFKKYEVRTRLKKMTFSILLNNHVIAGPCWGYQLEEKLNKYVT